MTKSKAINSSVKKNTTPASAVNRTGLSPRMKLIIGASAVVLVIGGLIIAAKPGPGAGNPAIVAARAAGPAASAGTLSALVTKFNFGSISMAAGKVTHGYWIKNTGTEPVIIRKIYTSCMCTTAALVKDGKKSNSYGMPGHGPIPTIDVAMKPGDQAMVEVVFDPAAHGPAGIGPTERVVTLENSAGRPLELAFAANVRP